MDSIFIKLYSSKLKFFIIKNIFYSEEMWILLLIILLFLLIAAFYWEFKDHNRIISRPQVNTLSPDLQNREYVFYACFNYENNIKWRTLFICSIISTLLITYILYAFHFAITVPLVLLIIGAIFFVFYGCEIFQNFHLYRQMCSKVKPDINIL